jgi:hypothetical protein
MAMKRTFEKVLILGGSGLVGFQIARLVALNIEPKTIFIVGLHQARVRDALQRLRKEFPKVTFDGSWGNVFLRSAWREKNRSELFAETRQLEGLVNDIYGDISSSSQKNFLSELIRKHKPDIIVDALPVAAQLSSQSDDLLALEIEGEFKSLRQTGSAKKGLQISPVMARKIEQLLVHQAIPHLTRHVQILNAAMRSAGTAIYIKVGTTGTGGMGLNIPYTNSEDKPSAKLMSKTAIAFAHTGLLFSMARTPGAPIVKEIKPAALIGSRQIEYRAIEIDGKPLGLFHAKRTHLGQKFNLVTDVGYAQRGELAVVGVNAGVSGFLAKGEFEAITTMFQMEFITPEEIAQTVVLEIQGVSTGNDVISSIDAAVMNPSYRAGLLREPILTEMQRLESKHQAPSVALGQVGPPELSKLLYEAWLIKAKYHDMEVLLKSEPQEVSGILENYLLRHPIRHTIISIGIPILLADGCTLIRGPRINIPEYRGDVELPVTPAAINKWADRGWVDMRPANMAKWQERIRQMQKSSKRFFSSDSSDLERAPCPPVKFEIGEAVGWIFNTDPSIAGYRMKAL